MLNVIDEFTRECLALEAGREISVCILEKGAEVGSHILSGAVLEPRALDELRREGASVAAVMGIFLWREMKRAERYERLYDDERKKRIDAENKCSGCEFVRKAHEEFLDNRD